jgi:cysteine synthase A
MQRAGTAGSIVTLLCDGGERYAQTCYDDEWLAANGIDVAAYAPRVTELLSARS